MIITKILLIGTLTFGGRPDIIGGYHDLPDCVYAASRYASGPQYSGVECRAYNDGVPVAVLWSRETAQNTSAAIQPIPQNKTGAVKPKNKRKIKKPKFNLKVKNRA